MLKLHQSFLFKMHQMIMCNVQGAVISYKIISNPHPALLFPSDLLNILLSFGIFSNRLETGTCILLLASLQLVKETLFQLIENYTFPLFVN